MLSLFQIINHFGTAKAFVTTYLVKCNALKLEFKFQLYSSLKEFMWNTTTYSVRCVCSLPASLHHHFAAPPRIAACLNYYDKRKTLAAISVHCKLQVSLISWKINRIEIPTTSKWQTWVTSAEAGESAAQLTFPTIRAAAASTKLIYSLLQWSSLGNRGPPSAFLYVLITCPDKL